MPAARCAQNVIRPILLVMYLYLCILTITYVQKERGMGYHKVWFKISLAC